MRGASFGVHGRSGSSADGTCPPSRAALLQIKRTYNQITSLWPQSSENATKETPIFRTGPVCNYGLGSGAGAARGSSAVTYRQAALLWLGVVALSGVWYFLYGPDDLYFGLRTFRP